MTRQVPSDMRGTMVPAPLWSAAYVERIAAQNAPQQTGCVHCALQGIADPLPTFYLVKGTSVCAAHIAQEQDTRQ